MTSSWKRRSLAMGRSLEQLQKGQLQFQRMTRFVSFRNVRAWQDLKHEVRQRTLAILLGAIVLAYAMSLTSSSLWTNLPVAFALLLLLRRLSFNYEIRWSPDFHPDCCLHNHPPAVHQLDLASPLLAFDLKRPSTKRPGALRGGATSPAVEEAVDGFTRAIVREWVTNLWYRFVTPDQDFPEQLQQLINRAIAEIAVRLQKANLISLLTRDLVEQLGHQLEVYRRAKDEVGQDVLDALSSSEQEERLRKAMLAQGNLHGALTSPKAEYRVLKRLMGGVVAVALRPEDLQCSLMRVIAREILASAVLRPVMSLINPGLLNELFVSSLAAADNSKVAKTASKEEESFEQSGSEPSSRTMSGVVETSAARETVEQGRHQKLQKQAGPSFGARDVEKFEKKKTALAAEHWDQMWVGAKGKRQRALAEARERRKTEGQESGHSSAGEGERRSERVLGSRHQNDVSPQGSSTTSLTALAEEEGSHLQGTVSLSTSGPGDLTSNKPVVPGIGWEKDDWDDPVVDPAMRTQRERLDTASTSGREVEAGKEQHVSDAGARLRDESPAVIASPGQSIKSGKVRTSYARGKVGLSKLDANWMGLDVPSTPLPTTRSEEAGTGSRQPLRSTRSEMVGAISNFPPLSTRSEDGLAREPLWEKDKGFQSARGGSSSWHEALEESPPKRHRRSFSGGLEALVCEDTWRDVSADVGEAQRPYSFEEERSERLERTASEELWQQSAPASPNMSTIWPPAGTNRVRGRVVGARMEESGGKAFAVYTIAVADSDRSSWLVQRRYRNFEALHRRLKDLSGYKLKLPPKRYLGANLDGSFVLERRVQLDKYLQDLLAVPSIAESHELWDFLSRDSHAYGYGPSPSMIRTLAGNVDDAVDTMFRRLNSVSDELQGAISKGLKKAPALTDMGLSKQKLLPKMSGPVEVAMADQAYRGEGDEEAFVEVQETEVNMGKQGEDARAWSWAPLPEGERLTSRPLFKEGAGQLGEQPGDPPRGESLAGAPSVNGPLSVLEERGSHVSPTDSGVVLDESDEEGEELPLAAEAHASKLSGPLLNLVDTVFQLQQYGWLRRQVVWMARQILEIALGDAIDDFILTKIQWLRQPEVIAAAIDGVKGLLWPNGVWFANQNQTQALPQQSLTPRGDAPKQGEKAKPITEPTGTDSGQIHRNNGNNKAAPSAQPRVRSESELEWDWNPPKPQLTFEERLEAGRKAALVKELFLDRAPAALVSLIGSKQYKRCARDVYSFLQSPLCVKQLSYSVLELLITVTFPELKALVQDVKQEGLQHKDLS